MQEKKSRLYRQKSQWRRHQKPAANSLDKVVFLIQNQNRVALDTEEEDTCRTEQER